MEEEEELVDQQLGWEGALAALISVSIEVKAHYILLDWHVFQKHTQHAHSHHVLRLPI